MRMCWLAFAGWFSMTALAAAQDGGRTEAIYQIVSPANQPTWRVAKADASGEMTLTFEGFDDATMHAVEGYFLMLPTRADAKRLARVQITDVAAKSVTLKTSPEAAKAFPEGSGVRLARPFPATTKQLRAIPELVEIGEPNADAAGAARTATDRARSVNNLKQIGLGLHNWHAVHDALPPAVVRGPDGKPWHSWRVLILPYIEQQDLFNQYDFSQPWDGENNLKLLDKMPEVYREPGSDAKGHFTHYAVISGESTAFPPQGMKMTGEGKDGLDLAPEGMVSFAAITDGMSNTIVVAPVSADRKIPWTKPADIPFGDDFPALGDPKGIAMPYVINGEKVAPVMLMDGSVKILSEKANREVVKALMTRAAGEVIPGEVFQNNGQGPAPPGTLTITIVTEGGKATATIR